MKKWSKWLFAFTLMSLLFVLAACNNDESNTSGEAGDSGATTEGGASTKNEVTIGITNPPGAFNPIARNDNTAWFVSTMVYSPFIMQGSDLEFHLKLAESIETEDNQTFTIKLHPDAVWSDGEKLTADDVLFTAKTIGTKEAAAISYGINQIKGYDDTGILADPNAELEGVKKVDDATVQFITKQPMDIELFYSLVASQFLTIPEHIFAEIAPADLATHSYMQNPPVASGPFTFGEYAANQYIALKSNDTYFLGRPKIDALYFKLMPAANIVAQLQSGEVDMNYPGIGTIAASDFERVQNLSNVDSEFGLDLDYNFLTFNFREGKELDVKVREAIAHAIDREMIVNNLLKGQGVVNDVTYSKQNKYYNENLETIKYDPEKAKKLLEEAGWDFNRQLTVTVPSGNTTREQMADLLIQNLLAVGLKVQLEKFDLPTVVANARSGDYELLILGLNYNQDPDAFSMYHTSGVNNFAKYSNAELDDLILKGLQEVTFETRKPIYDKVQEHLQANLPVLPLYYDKRLLAKNKRLVVGGPKDVGTLENVHLWEVQ